MGMGKRETDRQGEFWIATTERPTMQAKRRAYEILEVAAPGNRISRLFDLFILSPIGLSVIALVAETVEPVRAEAGLVFDAFEIGSVAIFTVEYALRLWSRTANPRYAPALVGRLRFVATPLALIDLMAILLFYLPFLGVDVRFIRSVRLFRLFRVAKLGRYSTAIRTVGRALVAKKEELAITLFVLFLLLLLVSCLMYAAEHEAQAEVFSSIPAAMWWAVATLTTVGYGDVYPVTVAGKLIASVIAALGIGMFALPTGILGAGFVEEMRKGREAPKACPHCGKELDG